MAERFEITVQRAEKHKTRLNSMAAKMERISVEATERELRALMAYLEGQVKQRTPVVTGMLRDSVFSEVHISGVSLEGLVSTPLVYGPPVEFGRKANASGRGGFTGRKMFERAWKENAGEVAMMLERIGVHVSAELLRNL